MLVKLSFLFGEYYQGRSKQCVLARDFRNMISLELTKCLQKVQVVLENSKSCFRIPSKCDFNCKVMVSYEKEGLDMVFKLVGYSDGYIAVGLSPDNDQMGEDLTTACYLNQGTGDVGIQSGYNVGKSNRPLRPVNAGIKNWNGRYEDGLITCEFRRPAILNIPLPHRNENKTFQLDVQIINHDKQNML